MLIKAGSITKMIDFRETAPGLSNETMFVGNPDASSTGPLSIAIPYDKPREIRSYLTFVTVARSVDSSMLTKNTGN
jgi:hypothetical protein